jgi:hypothetical protein
VLGGHRLNFFSQVDTLTLNYIQVRCFCISVPRDVATRACSPLPGRRSACA